MIRCLLCVLLVMQLVACASLPPLDETFNENLVDRNSLKVLAIDEWSLVGRLAVRSESDSWLTRLDWEHKDYFDTLLISTSLGGVLARLRFEGGIIYFTDSEGVVRIINEDELEEMLGYVPPIHQLKYWLRGVFDPSKAVITGRVIARHADDSRYLPVLDVGHVRNHFTADGAEHSH